MKILNLYAGIGGNRKLWGDEHEVTAIEIDAQIAKIYQDFFPNDKVIVTDAHQFLLEHYKEFDFIWSSPPCPSHSRLRKGFSMSVGARSLFPDMKLYEEIIFLEGYFKGKWVVENVKPYYKPLIEAQEVDRHYFWGNFIIPNKSIKKIIIPLPGDRKNDLEEKEMVRMLQEKHGFNIEKYKLPFQKKRYLLRNCVNSEIGLHIFKCAFKIKQVTLSD
jgi:DNA (cytosine-5)-methyltransferase 1